MKTILLSIALCVLFITTCQAEPLSNQCSLVDQRLLASEKLALTPVFIDKLRRNGLPLTTRVDIQAVFRFNAWSFFLVNTNVSDPVILFFIGNPFIQPITASWGGTARIDQGNDLIAWARKYVPGIPDPLAACFAGYVTHN